jgi:hypothetical protein
LPKFIRFRWLLLLGLIAVVAILATAWRSAIRKNRSIPDAQFNIAGNLYCSTPTLTLITPADFVSCSKRPAPSSG